MYNNFISNTTMTMKLTRYSLIPALFLVAFSFGYAQEKGFSLIGFDGIEKPPAEEKAVRPITAPFLNEDSFVTSDVRAWYAHHELDEINGSVDTVALQVRLAITESLQFLVYKDGYTNFKDTDVDGLVSDGFNDVGLGIKWAFIQGWDSQFHMAGGVGYEFGVGNDDVLQDTDELRLWLSANKGFGKLHLGATVNYIIAEDNGDQVLGNSDYFSVHLHADYYVNEWFSPVIEVNGYFVEDEGNNPAGLQVSGVDLVSIGAGEDNDTITGALGFEVRPMELLGFRAAYETQLNSGDSLFGYRWTFSAVYEF